MEKLPSLYTLLPQIPLMSINISYCIIFLFFIFKVFSLSFEETVLTSIKIYSSVFFSKISVAQITFFIYISLVRKLLHMLQGDKGTAILNKNLLTIRQSKPSVVHSQKKYWCVLFIAPLIVSERHRFEWSRGLHFFLPSFLELLKLQFTWEHHC